jgi:hypothetical protein
VAIDSNGAALLFPRRQGVALYAAALRCSGEVDSALSIARHAVTMPGEDIRSRVVALRELAAALAAVGDLAEAQLIAAEAASVAYASPQVGERAASDALVGSLAASVRVSPVRVEVGELATLSQPVPGISAMPAVSGEA